MRGIALAAALVAAMVSGGCMTLGPTATPTLGAEGFSYMAGRAAQEFAYPPSAVRSAVMQGMDDLRMQAVKQTNDGGTLSFNASTHDNRRVLVYVRPNQGASRVSIRIGWFGDEPLSRALMDRIGTRLGSLPPQAIPVDPPSSPDANPFLRKEKLEDSDMARERAEEIYHDSPIPQ